MLTFTFISEEGIPILFLGIATHHYLKLSGQHFWKVKLVFTKERTPYTIPPGEKQK